MASATGRTTAHRVRYAVVGLGHIAQVAVLPAFAHARENSELAALVSDDAEKLRELGQRYDVARRIGYDAYDDLVASGEIDAVYIALPNHLHADFALRAMRAGVHVLCEKPLAVTEDECRAMIRGAEEHGVRLMTAYRLHFEAANLEAVRLARSGEIGDPRLFVSAFGYQLQDRGNIRGRADTGGGPLHDIGVYCVNAARYLFGCDPVEAFAWQARSDQGRVGDDVEETVVANLRFPGDRLATFAISFAVAPVASYRLVGTKGALTMDPAYEYAEAIELATVIDAQERVRTYPKRDQFAPELIAFSRNVIEGTEPQPDGWEGLADVVVIEAIRRSLREGRAVPVRVDPPRRRPTPEQTHSRPPVREPDPLNAESPS